MPRPHSSAHIHVRTGQNKMGCSISGVFSSVQAMLSGMKSTAIFWLIG